MTSSSLKMEEVSSLLWPRRRSRARRAYLRRSLYLHWVSTLEERLVERKVVSSSACLNTWDKVALWCPHPRRGLLQQRRIVLRVSKHQGNLALILRTWCPRPRRGLPEGSAISSPECLKTPRRSVLLVPTPEERHAKSNVVSSLVCLNTKMTRDFGDYTQGEGFPKDGTSPT